MAGRGQEEPLTKPSAILSWKAISHRLSGFVRGSKIPR
jgi:hypothetical protein